jgi:hypothetical protein
MKTVFRFCLIVVLCLMVISCVPQVAQTPVVTDSSTEALTEVPEIIPASALEIPAEPASTVSMDARIITSIDTGEHPLASPTLSGNAPEEIVFANEFIWVHLVNGHMIQVDPVSNAMVGAIKTDTTTDPYHYCQGLGTDGKDIWACSAAGDENNKTINVVRIDTTTQSIVATFQVEKIWDQLYMPFAYNQIWVLTEGGSKLVGIDIANNQPNPAIELGVRCFHLTALDNILYASCGVDNLVIKINAETNEIVTKQSLQSPGFIFAAKDGVWVSQANSVTRIDSETLLPVVTITGITTSDINETENAIWVWEYGKGILYKIDPATNEVAELIKPEKPFISGGGVLPFKDSLWLTVDENDLLLRLDLQ